MIAVAWQDRRWVPIGKYVAELQPTEGEQWNRRPVASAHAGHADRRLTCELTQIGRCREFVHLLRLPCFAISIIAVRTVSVLVGEPGTVLRVVARSAAGTHLAPGDQMRAAWRHAYAGQAVSKCVLKTLHDTLIAGRVFRTLRPEWMRCGLDRSRIRSFYGPSARAIMPHKYAYPVGAHYAGLPP